MKKIRSLSTKIAILVTFILVFLNLFAGLYMSNQIKAHSTLQFQKEVFNTLKSIAANIDGNRLQQDIINDTRNYYDELNIYLGKAFETGSFKFLYTSGPLKDQNFYYLVDSYPKNSEDCSQWGSPILEDPKMNQEISLSLSEALKQGELLSEVQYSDEWGSLVTGSVAIYNSEGQAIALLSADFDANQYLSTINSLSQKVILILIGSTLFIVCVITFTIKRALKPLSKIQKTVSTISSGDLNVILENTSGDEIGQIALATNEMAKKLKSLIGDIQKNAEGLFTYSSGLVKQSQNLNEASNQIATETMNIGNNALEDNVQAQSIIHIMSQMDQELLHIVDTIQRVNVHVNESYSEASQGEEIIQKTHASILQAHTSMEDSKNKLLFLHNHITDITQFVDAITNISKQTNLLALNASIEAARAGAEGNGFQIVALEVRKLAEQSNQVVAQVVEILEMLKRSTVEITSSLTSTYKELTKATASSEEAKSCFQTILSSNTEIKDSTQIILTKVQAYSVETKDAVYVTQDIGERTQSLAHNCQSISAATEEQLAYAQELLQGALYLEALSKSLDKSIALFKVN